MIKVFKNKIIKFIIYNFFSLFYISNSFSLDQNVNCYKKFKIALNDFGLFYSKETKSGIDKDLAMELEKRSKCVFEYIDNLSKIQILKSLENGSVDFTTSSLETTERNSYAYFIHYQQSKNYIFVRKTAKAKSWDDFISNHKLKFGVVKGFRHGISDDKILYIKKQNRVLEYNNLIELFNALSKNEVQAVLGLVPVSKFYLNKEKGLEKLLAEYDWNPKEMPVKNGFMLSKKSFSKEELDKWDFLLNSIVKDGTLNKIFRKYLNENEANNLILKK